MSTRENALATKLGGAKISDDELERRLAAANQKIAGASSGFADWAGADLEEAVATAEKLEPGGDNEEATGLIFRVAHDLKGQGSTFGYPLMTQIAGLLCNFIRSSTSPLSSHVVNVIRAHLSALYLILKQDIRGEGDAAAQQLVEKLAMAAERVKRKGEGHGGR